MQLSIPTMSSAGTVPKSESLPSPGLPNERSENGNLPIDRSIRYEAELYPRDPDAYEPLDHFYQRQQETERFLTKEIEGYSAVRKTILAGIREENYGGTGAFVLPWYGVAYYIIIGHHLQGYRITISGWPYIFNEEFAQNSDEWCDAEIATIKRFRERWEDRRSYSRPYRYDPKGEQF